MKNNSKNNTNPEVKQNDELAEEQLDKIAGGITPIPIPGAYLNLSSLYLSTALKQYSTTSFESGGGLG
jgi:hypothetical protein